AAPRAGHHFRTTDRGMSHPARHIDAYHFELRVRIEFASQGRERFPNGVELWRALAAHGNQNSAHLIALPRKPTSIMRGSWRGRERFWSGRGESNPRLQLGKLPYNCHSTAALTT